MIDIAAGGGRAHLGTRTAASAAESPPRGRGFRGGVTWRRPGRENAGTTVDKRKSSATCRRCYEVLTISVLVPRAGLLFNCIIWFIIKQLRFCLTQVSETLPKQPGNCKASKWSERRHLLNQSDRISTSFVLKHGFIQVSKIGKN